MQRPLMFFRRERILIDRRDSEKHLRSASHGDAAGIAVPLITAMMWMRSNDQTPRTEIHTPAGSIVVEIAATPASRTAGLSNRYELRGIDGILLKCDAPGRHPIWMQAMQFPLDLIWIDPTDESSRSWQRCRLVPPTHLLCTSRPAPIGL